MNLYRQGARRIIFLVTIAALSGVRPAIPEKATGPIWELDLSQFGYILSQERVHHDASVWANSRGVAFVGPQRLVAYFVTRGDSTELSTRKEPRPTDPYHLHAVFLDPIRHQILSQQKWPVRPSNPSYFFSATNGQFIVGDGDGLSLYSADWSRIATFKKSRLSQLGSSSIWTAQISPDGETLLTQHDVEGQGAHQAQLDLINVGQMSLLKTWTKATYGQWALWGNELAWHTEHDLYLETTESEPRLLAHTQGRFCGAPAFINRDTLLVADCGPTLTVLSTDGNVVNQLDIGDVGVALPTAIPSRNGRTFAIPTFVPGLFDSPVPRRMSVQVFDANSTKSFLTIKIPPTALGWSGIALSPQGDLLAVGEGKFVRVYRVSRQ